MSGTSDSKWIWSESHGDYYRWVTDENGKPAPQWSRSIIPPPQQPASTAKPQYPSPATSTQPTSALGAPFTEPSPRTHTSTYASTAYNQPPSQAHTTTAYGQTSTQVHPPYTATSSTKPHSYPHTGAYGQPHQQTHPPYTAPTSTQSSSYMHSQGHNTDAQQPQPSDTSHTDSSPVSDRTGYGSTRSSTSYTLPSSGDYSQKGWPYTQDKPQ